MSFLSKDVGVDLGTANTLVYMKGKGIIMREPSVVAVDTKTDEVRCVGAEAKAVIGRTPGSIVAVRPLKDGVIADFDITANMLENFLKKACGNSMFSRSAYPMDPEMTMEIKGRNLVDGLPKNIVVHSEDVREALLECLVKITSAIKETLERTPPELSADIIDHGITLTGGGALLRGLDQLIQSETGIDVHVAEDPLDCVAKGAGAVLDHVDVLHDVLDTDGAHM